MKKFFTLFIIAPFLLSAQVFVEQDFEQVPLGIFGTDIEMQSFNEYGWALLSTNDTQGQFATSTNASTENFLIIQEDSKKLQITGPNATTGYAIAIPYMETGLADWWAMLETDNNVLQVNATMNVAASESLNTPVLGIFDAASYIAGVYFSTATNIVYGVAYIEGSNGQQGAYLINLIEGGLPFERDTDYDFEVYFDVTTGVVTWVCDQLDLQGSIETLKVGVSPREVDFLMLNGTTTTASNTTAGTFTLDNVLVEAVPEVNLSTQNLSIAGRMESRIYPNPAKETLSIELAAEFNATKSKVTIHNVNGKKVAAFNTTQNMNISHLPAGVYILTVSDGNKTESHKLIKK